MIVVSIYQIDKALEYYQKSYDYMQKAIKILEKSLPFNHPDLKSAREGLEVIKSRL
ncbi:hypothetical protein MNB_SV-15-685 [hydrothermal vent metagenome]|uniref:Tetratricopeptide repeat protein n=1 Tax=hydrothermal vent metagenome TaxID=652676 RepID=A0A1W1EHS3_9ZZZZ